MDRTESNMLKTIHFYEDLSFDMKYCKHELLSKLAWLHEKSHVLTHPHCCAALAVPLVRAAAA